MYILEPMKTIRGVHYDLSSDIAATRKDNQK